MSAAELSRVARRWRGAFGDLLSRDIAHNDLQHGNIMVQPDSSIRLVDYDGIFLPQYQGTGQARKLATGISSTH